MSAKLRDVIRAVKECKTAADERAVVRKEGAAIRTAFREGKDLHRARNVSKLIYFYILGYPTDYGQMEPIKLMTSESFADKWMGYLALSILIDEGDDVLTLVEHRIKQDLESKDVHVQTLALLAIANIAGEDMARDLSPEVERFLTFDDEVRVPSTIRKKAFLAALRITRKVPVMAENFLPKLSSIFLQTDHSVLMCGLKLITECLQTEFGQEYIGVFRESVPRAKNLLKKLNLPSEAVDYERKGIADPFLQVQLLQFLRVVAVGNELVSEKIADTLAQLLTTTTDAKLASAPVCGNSIVYETIKTMIDIESSQQHRDLAISKLGVFLVSRDSNTKYVALNTLLRLINRDTTSVQAHISTIVNCMRDADAPIRKRALELIYYLINEKNIRLLVLDLMHFLSSPCRQDFKEDLTDRICTAAARFAPTRQWHVNILIKLLVHSGNCVPESATNRLVTLVAQSDKDMQTLTVCRLWNEICKPLQDSCMQNTNLLTVGIWCVGEYADLLVKAAASGGPAADAGAAAGEDEVEGLPPVTAVAEDLVTTTNAILQSSDSASLKMYCLNALMKIVVRFPSVRLLVLPTFETYQASLDLELQQRAWEYLQMLQVDASDMAVASAAFDRMPIHGADEAGGADILQADMQGAGDAVADTAGDITVSAVHSPPRLLFTDGSGDHAVAPPKPAHSVLDDVFAGLPSAATTATAAAAAAPAAKPAGLSLDDIFGSATTTTTTTAAAPAAAMAPAASTTSAPAAAGHFDPFGGMPAAAPAPVPAPAAVPAPAPAAGGGAFDIFGDVPAAPAAAPQVAAFVPPPTLIGRCDAFQNNHLKVEFMMCRPNPAALHDVRIHAVVYNTGCPAPLSDVQLMAAVTKSATVTLMHHVGNGPVQPGGYWVQPIDVNNDQNGNAGAKPPVFKVRLSYTPPASAPVNVEFLVKDLPSTAI